MFRVGQKLVCVDDGPDSLGRPAKLKLNRVYTIVRINATHDRGLHLQETECNSGLGFWPRRFRPIVERKTDISVFTAMLTGSKIGADA